jgi:hypothetical protein
MPGLRQFAFPSNPFAIVILLGTVAAAVWALSPARTQGGLHATRSSISTPAGTVPVYVVRVSLADGRYRVAPGVAVALSGGELWLVGAGGRGLTVPELQRTLVSMGARSAIAFAGGESADLVVGGRPLLGHVELTPADAVTVLSR